MKRACSTARSLPTTRRSPIKAANAKSHGARGVIMVNDVAAHPDGDKLVDFARDNGPTDSGIFFVQVKASNAETWLKAEGRDLAEIEAGIDKDLKPRSFALAKLNVDLAVDIQHDNKTVHNVAAYLPGETKEYVVIGAHYDHLGLGDEHSLAPSQIGQVHPGADDNASGTAGVIELARYFSKQPKPKRGILFLTFAGEELGLLGSSWYVNHPILPLENAVAMINMDMIGRIRDGKVYVNGTGTGSTLTALVEGHKAAGGTSLRSLRTDWLRRQRPHVVHHQEGAGALLLLRLARRLSQAERHRRIRSTPPTRLSCWTTSHKSLFALENDPGRPQFVRLARATGARRRFRKQQRLRLRTELRQHSGLRRASQGGAFRGRAGRHAGGEGWA